MFAAYNIPWPEVNQLTLSFAPDGTSVGQESSALFSTLNQTFGNQDWQLAILQAFQTWAVESGVNIGLVADQGNPINSIGFKQGDPRFGDIRIGSLTAGNDVLAVANPYDPFIANTWVGDVFLNSNSSFIAQAADPRGALFTIMLHEAGHVLGIEHSNESASAMYPQFQTVRTGLSSSDVASLQNLYGSRSADNWEGAAGNDSLNTAAAVSFYDQTLALRAPAWTADLTTAQDIDYYKLTVPNAAQSIDIQLAASGLSLLTSKLTVLNAAGQVLASALATDPRANSLSLHLPNVQPGEQLFLRVEAADDSVFGIGTYELHVMPQTNSRVETYHFTTDIDIEDAGVHTLATTPGYVEHTYYEVYGALSPAVSEQVYRVRSADLGPDLLNIFTVVLGTELPLDQFAVELRDEQGTLVPYQILQQADDKLAIQVTGVHSAVDYFIQISSTQSLAKKAHYELEVDFAQDGQRLQNYVNDQITDTQTVVSRVLDIRQSQHFHFVLGTSDWSQPQEAGLLMSISDAAGRVVYLMQAPDGGVRSGDVFLPVGVYSVRFTSPQRTVGNDIIFQLSGFVADSPIGPQLRDTVSAPVNSNSPGDSLTAFWLPGRGHLQQPLVANQPRNSTVAYGTLYGANTAAISMPSAKPLLGSYVSSLAMSRNLALPLLLNVWDLLLAATSQETMSESSFETLGKLTPEETIPGSNPSGEENPSDESQSEMPIELSQFQDSQPAREGFLPAATTSAVSSGKAMWAYKHSLPTTEPFSSNQLPVMEAPASATPPSETIPPQPQQPGQPLLNYILAGLLSSVVMWARRIKKFCAN